MRSKFAALFNLVMILYFAYGSNMDLVQMADRCPNSATIGTAELPCYRFIINSYGGATVVPDPVSAVHGLLWNITEEDERSLDRYEGVKRGVYRKDYVEVRLPDGQKTRALIYIGTNTQPGTARNGYMEKVYSAAQGCGLPKSYIDQLKAWCLQPAGAAGRKE
jgi:gamma-glutamylcyclotransferase (GGCT)/AIG2-like uncharacterized protein YtfP